MSVSWHKECLLLTKSLLFLSRQIVTLRIVCPCLIQKCVWLLHTLFLFPLQLLKVSSLTWKKWKNEEQNENSCWRPSLIIITVIIVAVIICFPSSWSLNRKRVQSSNHAENLLFFILCPLLPVFNPLMQLFITTSTTTFLFSFPFVVVQTRTSRIHAQEEFIQVKKKKKEGMCSSSKDSYRKWEGETFFSFSLQPDSEVKLTGQWIERLAWSPHKENEKQEAILTKRSPRRICLEWNRKSLLSVHPSLLSFLFFSFPLPSSLFTFPFLLDLCLTLLHRLSLFFLTKCKRIAYSRNISSVCLRRRETYCTFRGEERRQILPALNPFPFILLMIREV